MPKPTKEQLKRINQFSQTELTEDQVYVFTSLSADTLPIDRASWFGRYHLMFSPKMLNDLKRSFREGVGLLASHNKNRLPFGRTFDAEIKVDHVNGESVETLYIDHYIVTHMKDEEGNKVPLRTEINGMSTQDIVNHIEAGHAFDTSVGVVIKKPVCSICKHDIRDHEKCSHIPGKVYDVQMGDKTEKVRCDLIADGGEALENSLVYAGAVDRAIIQKANLQTQTSDDETVQGSVKVGEVTLYNVGEIKSLPLDSEILCYMSKGQVDLYTTTPDRQDISKFKEGSEEMPNTKTVQAQGELQVAELQAFDTVSLQKYTEVVSERDSLSTDLSKAEEKIASLEADLAKMKEDLETKDALIAELTKKSELADKFTEDLINDVVKAGIKARGNAFNAERYEKYARTLSVDELKEELQAFQEEFSESIDEARVTKQELEDEEEVVETLSKSDLRQKAARIAMERFKRDGGNLEEMTKQEFSKLLEKYKIEE